MSRYLFRYIYSPVLAVVPAPGPGVPVQVEEVVTAIGEVSPSPRLGTTGPSHRQLHVQLLLGRPPHLYSSDQDIIQSVRSTYNIFYR